MMIIVGSKKVLHASCAIKCFMFSTLCIVLFMQLLLFMNKQFKFKARQYFKGPKGVVRNLVKYSLA